MRVTMVVVAAALLAGCVTLTPEQREWRDGIDLENWTNCMRGYAQAGVMTVHIDHQHRRPMVDHPGDRWDIRDDLRVNKCQRALGKIWAEY